MKMLQKKLKVQNMRTFAFRPPLAILTKPQRLYEMALMSSIEAIFGNT